jgi:hypothetical protein
MASPAADDDSAEDNDDPNETDRAKQDHNLNPQRPMATRFKADVVSLDRAF